MLGAMSPGLGEARRAQEIETIIKRALVAIDAAFERQQAATVRSGNGLVVSGNERRIWKDTVSDDVKIKSSEKTEERDKRVIHMRYVDKLTHKKIGERIGMSSECVKKLFGRLRKAGKLKDYEK